MANSSSLNSGGVYTTWGAKFKSAGCLQHRHCDWASNTITLWVSAPGSEFVSEKVTMHLADLHASPDREAMLRTVFLRLTSDLEEYIRTLTAMECV
jgi:hypothetical protein